MYLLLTWMSCSHLLLKCLWALGVSIILLSFNRKQ